MRIPTKLIRSQWPPNDGLMPGDKHFDDVLESIEAEGIREPLTMTLSWELIDGNHRLWAARLLGIETVEVRVWTGVEFVQ